MTIHEIMEREDFQPLKLFLTDRGDYQRFMYNAEEFNTAIIPTNENELLSRAFIWDSSPEGGAYWTKLDIEYSFLSHLLRHLHIVICSIFFNFVLLV